MKFLFLAATFLLFVLAANAGELPDRSVLRIALREYTRPTAAAGLEFSADGRSMCVWWWPHPAVGDQTTMPLEFVIVDTLGKVLSVSRSSTNRANTLEVHPFEKK